MSAPEGYGAIYVFRPRMPPGEVLWGVNLDARHFGYLAPGSYLYGFVRPGQHSLDLNYLKSTIHFVASSGENNYYKITMGFPGMVLGKIDRNEAKALLSDYSLSGLNSFENDADRKLLDRRKPAN